MGRIDFAEERKLDRVKIAALATCAYVERGGGVVLQGLTGSCGRIGRQPYGKPPTQGNLRNQSKLELGGGVGLRSTPSLFYFLPRANLTAAFAASRRREPMGSTPSNTLRKGLSSEIAGSCINGSTTTGISMLAESMAS